MKLFVKRTTELINFISVAQNSQITDISSAATIFSADELKSIWPNVHDKNITKLYQEYQQILPINNELLKQHLAQIWILQLRLQCTLRGVRPSQILGSINDVLIFNTPNNQNNNHNNSHNSSHNNNR
jgi:hypothetical protein